MVLAEAFMKRNDIKKQISKLLSEASLHLWQDKTMPINFETGTAQHPTVALAEAIKLMDELQALNIAITTANMVNNDLLRELETISAKISLVEQVVSAAEGYPGDKVKERGGYLSSETSIIVENEWNIDPKLMQVTLKGLQEQKRALEKKLQHSNFITEVVF